MQCQPVLLHMTEEECAQCFIKLREKVKELKKTLQVPVQENVEEKELQINAAATSDTEKNKLMQKQLMALLHAQRCFLNGCGFNIEGSKCLQLHCKAMKYILNHLKTCHADVTCPVPLCVSSREIMSHWKNCKETYCHVCLPVRQKLPSGLEKSVSPWASLNSNIDNLFKSSHESSMAFLQAALAIQDTPIYNSNVYSYPSSSTTIKPLATFWPRSSLYLTESVPGTKDWHKTITLSQRNNSIGKLYQEMKPNMWQHEETQCMGAEAKKMEAEMYLTANSIIEYCQLLDERIHKIKQECIEKWLGKTT